MKIAQEIYRQFGGSRAMAMISGMPVETFGGLGINFRGSRFANKVVITLSGDDTYTMTFYLLHRTNLRVTYNVADVYAADLARIFSERTGLALSL
jgi:hypothetical protein